MIKKLKGSQRKKINYNFQTISLENCGDKWINLQEYVCNLSPLEDFSI